MPCRRTVLLLALCSAAAAAPACASGRLVDVQIVDRSQGQALPVWRHRGADWVAGQPGNRYAVQLVNRTGARVLVVLSVDGINAVTGETAGVGQSGYVLGPWQSAEITGWRKSEREAAAFYFTALADSYAARTDRPDNVGVIGAAVFRERVRWEEPRDVAPFSWQGGRGERERGTRDAAGGPAEGADPRRAEAGSKDAPAAAAPAARDGVSGAFNAPAPTAEAQSLAKSESRLGTGHGEREWSPVTRVSFERASSQPAELVRVRYDSWRNLVASGVIPGTRADPQPEAFPRWVPDPR
jgi:hypothetical protein